MVETHVAFNPKSFGEQAGLFWYIDDNNYVKFVVEGMKDGSVAFVFAHEMSGNPIVVRKEKINEKLLSASPSHLNRILRLEFDSSTTSFKAYVVHPQGVFDRVYPYLLY